MDSGVAPKEATILQLAEEIGKGLEELRARLDSRFDRTPKPMGESKESGIIPNVLDEIIAVLKDDEAYLLSMAAFISAKVLPKINE